MFGLEWIPFQGWLFYFCLAYYCGKHYQQFIALLNRFQLAVYGLIIVSAMNVLSNSYLGFFTLSSKRPDVVLLYSKLYFLMFSYVFKSEKSPCLCTDD
ncbi:hypothetical protein ACEQPO_14490 [Bacillus sp. SL00103]